MSKGGANTTFGTDDFFGTEQTMIHSSVRSGWLGSPKAIGTTIAFKALLLTVPIIVLAWLPQQADAQVTLQLPQVAVFNVQTVVSAPDGGSAFLGGISRSSTGGVTRGVPGLSNIPGAGRLFKNRGIGRESSNSSARTHVRIFSLKEMEEDVMAEARARATAREATDPNGTAAERRKADFISRNIGKKKR